MKPSGQRRAKRCAAQAASSGNRASNAARDIGRSCFQRGHDRTIYEYKGLVNTSEPQHLDPPDSTGEAFGRNRFLGPHASEFVESSLALLQIPREIRRI
jgi:hypothetical protein